MCIRDSYWTDPIILSFINSLIPNFDDPPPIDTTITVDNIKQDFKIWREATSTSPSGRKLPLYKIWLQPDVDDAETMTGDKLFQIITDIIVISQKLQHPLRRWTTVYNMFVCKERGNFNIDRLRPLHNIEAELNLIRRELISRMLMKNAEAYGCIPTVSYTHLTLPTKRIV